MADAHAAPMTSPLAKGVTTSEGMLTIAAVILGTGLEALGSFLSHETLTHVGSIGWAVAPIIAGAFLQICTVFGYTKGRTLIKQQALVSGLNAALPLAVQVAEAVADKLSGVSSTASAALPASVVAPKAPSPSSFASYPR